MGWVEGHWTKRGWRKGHWRNDGPSIPWRPAAPTLHPWTPSAPAPPPRSPSRAGAVLLGMLGLAGWVCIASALGGVGSSSPSTSQSATASTAPRPAPPPAAAPAPPAEHPHHHHHARAGHQTAPADGAMHLCTGANGAAVELPASQPCSSIGGAEGGAVVAERTAETGGDSPYEARKRRRLRRRGGDDAPTEPTVPTASAHTGGRAGCPVCTRGCPCGCSCIPCNHRCRH